jgi:hypothetical protein
MDLCTLLALFDKTGVHDERKKKALNNVQKNFPL